jgi:hypothetical protein
MVDGRTSVILGVLAAGVLAPFACSPQIVDAVDTLPATGGSRMTGGSGGSGVTGGTSGTGASDGGGPACPDGGSEANQDGDEYLDCEEECPLDPNKSVPGQCGCGLPNPNEVDGGASCNDLTALLAHRYTFRGTSDSTVVIDSQAGMEGNGEVINTFLSGDETLVLAGGASDQYVDLPNGLASAQASATFEAWLQWSGGGGPWQRIFDFGSNSSLTEGNQGGSGASYLFLTARTYVDPANPALLLSGKLRLVYRRVPLEPELIVEAPIAFPSGGEGPTHVAAVIDAENERMSIYIEGVLQLGVAFIARGADGSDYVVVNNEGPYDWSVPLTELGEMTPPPIVLQDLNDINNWLGRSQFSNDSELAGTFHEFRIYQGALTAEQIAISYTAGPNPVFFQ